jgi:phage antirepressor YoqD-like protein
VARSIELARRKKQEVELEEEKKKTEENAGVGVPKAEEGDEVMDVSTSTLLA